MATSEHDPFRALVDHSPLMLWRAGPDGEPARIYFNAAWLAFTGRTLEREVGHGWAEGVHPDDVGALQAAYLDAFERRQPFEMAYRLRRFDGVYRTVVDRARPYEAAGAFGGFSGSCLDVDDLRESDLSSGADDFFEMSLDHLAVAGFDGYFRRLNPSWTRTLGWTDEELMSRPSLDFVHPEDREATLTGRQRLTVGSSMGPLVNRYLCKDGTYRWFEWRSVANLDRGLVYAAARDITEQKSSEERLAQAKVLQEMLQRQLVFADRMASVGTLAAGVAHEINNPLAAVAVNISMIVEGLRRLGTERSSVLTTELKEMAADVQLGAERIRKIVLGLKTFSGADEDRLAVIDARPVLDLAVDMTLNEIRRRARLVRDYGSLPLVEADDARLGQVFVNLLLNAAQAIHEGDSTVNEIRIVTSTDAAGRAVIEVRDTGVGIPAKVIGRVFDPFFTTKPVGVGTGLGLSICHNIVTSMNGQITVVSAPDRGTTFRVVLPAASGVPSEAVAPAKGRIATGS